MFPFHVLVVIFARYQFPVDHSSVISDFPVEKDQTSQNDGVGRGENQ
jgi:hypothetical protein